MITRERIKHYTLWTIIADFPIIYLGSVTIEHFYLTITSLVIMIIAITVSAWGY